MASNYKAISDEHWIAYGNRIERWAPKFLANQYDDRTHFIFELLQNAEDALSLRKGKTNRRVSFQLCRNGLRISHFGKPFDEANVRAICSIGESTKEDDLTAIGKFGIGFKSVYALTDRPEVHSGEEHFAIDLYVHPVGIESIPLSDERTEFWLPFKPSISECFDEVAAGLRSLPASTLLFLTHIDEIAWQIEGGESGRFVRRSKRVGPLVRESVIKQEAGGLQIPPSRWLISSRSVDHKGRTVGAAELAFKLSEAVGAGRFVVEPITDSNLVAFFPTVVPSKLGFLVQAPFRTTPSRDNIPQKDPWNQHLMVELSKLLADTLVGLRDLGALSLELLSALPLNRAEFPAETRMAPLYEATFETIQRKPILPTADDSWVNAKNALIARGDDLRKLLKKSDVKRMFGFQTSVRWLHPNLTVTRHGALYRYLTGSHGVEEVTPEKCVPKFSREFLESQPDTWICALYGFLLGQSAIMRETSFLSKPWVRLEDGRHVALSSGQQTQAFLPVKNRTTGFPTVRATLLKNKSAVEFFQRIGVTEPDPVDDVIQFVLPKYESGEHEKVESYSDDIERIVAASKVDSSKQQDKLVAALKAKQFVFSVSGVGKKFWSQPTGVYISTGNLKTLFEGVSSALFVDDCISCLKGEAIRSLLRRCGAAQYLEKVPAPMISWEFRQKLRNGRNISGNESVEDRDIRGLEELLKVIPKLPKEEAFERCKLLWDALIDLVRDSRESVLYGVYRWKYYNMDQESFLATFVGRLRNAKWIPAEDGKLVRPIDAVFERIPEQWPENASLQKALGFKPPVLEILAKEAEIDPELLYLLKRKGLTKASQLTELLGDDNEEGDEKDGIGQDETEGDDSQKGAGSEGDPSGAGSSRTGVGSSNGTGRQKGTSTGSGERAKSRTSANAGRRYFISYISTQPIDEEEEDVTDVEAREERMRVESIAIDHILRFEPTLIRTPAGNPGFDLYEVNEADQPNRWVEVKAMVGVLSNHPVGMSKRQFEMAQEKKSRYWLYIVESATSDHPRILMIQDPAGNARTFTFDAGWAEVARIRSIDLETGEVEEREVAST